MSPTPSFLDEVDRPYFFLSYARIPRTRPDESDPNLWVAKLFNDLCVHVMQLSYLPGGGRPGFMDRAVHPGGQWPAELSAALANCRVFVPLYSARYFHSDLCGREWAAFLQREAPQREAVRAIVPAIWAPVDSAELPAPAQEIQSVDAGMGGRYLENGFYGLIKLTKYRQHYSRAVFELAKRIVEIGEQVDVPVGAPVDYQSIQSAFESVDPQPVVRVTILAPSLDELAPSRSPYFYGRDPIEWTPFRDRNTSRPLGDVLAEILVSLGYRAEVRGFAERGPADHPDAPEVVIADPWLLANPDRVAVLSRIQEPWVAILIPWNAEDHQLPADPDELLAGSRGMQVITSVEGLRRAAPLEVAKIMQAWLRHSPVYPPEGGPLRRPRLWRPEIDPEK
jgi:FxsC-like protein